MNNVDEYIESFSDKRKDLLKQLRQIIKETIPVSYTHLDVYKRQADHPWGTVHPTKADAQAQEHH